MSEGSQDLEGVTPDGIDADFDSRLLLGTVPLPTCPVFEVHQRVAQTLDSQERACDPLAGLSEHCTNGRIHAEFCQHRLFGGEELPQGQDKLPRVDLTGSELVDIAVIVISIQ
ncbi:hypothetical protein [Glycomyces sambucus]|uniref:hypothetical protein n=1 Tax=Glycomyces sambucus TaxID=380244 RepID=UPI000B8271E3|nr:hypothetical protein [Glycomyces sambucus]